MYNTVFPFSQMVKIFHVYFIQYIWLYMYLYACPRGDSIAISTENSHSYTHVGSLP